MTSGRRPRSPSRHFYIRWKHGSSAPAPSLRRPGAQRPHPAGPAPDPGRPGRLHVGQHQARLRPGMAPVRGLDKTAWPGPPPAGDARAGGRVPGGAGRGGDRVDTTGEGGGHPPAHQVRPGGGPPVDRSPGSHRQRGGEEGHGRYCPGQRPPAAPGEAVNRDGPGGSEGHSGNCRESTRAGHGGERAPGTPSAADGWTSRCCRC